MDNVRAEFEIVGVEVRLNLYTTQNGFQWGSVSFYTPEEVQAAIKCLQDKLPSFESRKVIEANMSPLEKSNKLRASAKARGELIEHYVPELKSVPPDVSLEDIVAEVNADKIIRVPKRVADAIQEEMEGEAEADELEIASNAEEPLVEDEPETKSGYICEDCREIIDPSEEDVEVPLYECNNCGTIFNRNNSLNNNHQCPDCYKFASKLDDQSCPQCEQGQVSECQFYVNDDGEKVEIE